VRHVPQRHGVQPHCALQLAKEGWTPERIAAEYSEIWALNDAGELCKAPGLTEDTQLMMAKDPPGC